MKAKPTLSLIQSSHTLKCPGLLRLMTLKKKPSGSELSQLQTDNRVLLGEIMFGSSEYPIWGGYSIGFDIMQTAFRNHPHILKTNWTNLEAEKLLELSDYN